MTVAPTQNRRVLIVGAKFGEIYLNAFMQAQPGLELAGLLATGSARAQQLAHAYGIALYTAVEQVPMDIDIACVVVRSTVAGGTGSSLAQTFLQRGVHVIQEHPLHPDELAHLQNLAAQHRCTYWVNSFYPHTPAGRCWIGRAQRVRELLGGEPAHFAQLTTSRQLLYSSLDLLLLACDASEVVGAALVNDDDLVFHALRLQLPGCRAALRLQTYLDPDDPDLHSLAMHQLTLGWPSGYLTLEASYGPVLWISALHDPQHRQSHQSLYRRAAGAEGAYLSRPCATTLCAAPGNAREAFEADGPDGVGQLLQALRRHLDGASVPAACDAGHQLALARLWQQILHLAGPARERRLPAPQPIETGQLLAAPSREHAT